MDRKKVVVFGSFVVDLMARAPHLPTAAETVLGTMFRMGPGGKGFNQAVAAHKAGADSVCVTKLGRDSFADVALGTMDSLGMPKDRIFFSEEAPTGSALVMVGEDSGQNQIIIVPGACATITEAETESLRPVFEEAAYVLLQLEVNQDANERVADLAAECGCRVIVNTAPAAPLSDSFLAKAYMVTPNEVEAAQLSGIPVTDAESAAKAADWFHEKGVAAAVITMGSAGAFVSAEGIREMVPAFRVEAQDTTGAGDAFNGGLLAALAEGQDLREAARFASALAAISVTRIGTTPSMPTREEVEAFLSAAEAQSD